MEISPPCHRRRGRKGSCGFMSPRSTLCTGCGPGDNKSCEAQYIISSFMRCGTDAIWFLQLCVMFGVSPVCEVQLLTKAFPAVTICNTVLFWCLVSSLISLPFCEHFLTVRNTLALSASLSLSYFLHIVKKPAQDTAVAFAFAIPLCMGTHSEAGGEASKACV